MIRSRHPGGFANRTADSFHHSPMLVFYEVTQACDLVCQHCRACAQPRQHPSELSPDLSRQLIDQLTEFPQPPMLILTGGDPLKRGDVFDLVRYAVDRGLETSMTPSATPLVTRDALRRLRDAGISRIAISIDGPDAESHDRVRGVRGSFQRSLEILGDASELGIETQINTTLTPGNVDRIEEMADRFADLKITLWSVFFLVPVGRAEVMPRLDADRCEVAFRRLWEQAKKQPYLIKTTEAPHYRRFSLQQQVAEKRSSGHRRAFLPAGVNDGKGVMFVGHTGLIYPSGFLPIVCGVFPQQHVVKVYRDSPVFKKLRDPQNLQGKCGYCEYRKICGGSRARAYAVTGNLFAEEPDCAYLPKAPVGR